MSLRTRLSQSPLAPSEQDALSDIDRLDDWLANGISPNPALVGKHIVIIGGSFAGLMTALALQRLGLRVSVFERVQNLREGGAGIGIEDTSLACLEAFGLGEQLRESASLPLRRQITRTNDKEVYRSAFPYVSCYWNDIYRALYNALPEGVVHFGQNFAGFRENADGTLTVSVGQIDVSCDALIGCDGPTSSVRRLLHPDSSLIYRGYTTWRGVVDKDVAPAEVISALYEYYDSLGDGAVYFQVGSRASGHLVVYELPGNETTGRKINFVWYEQRGAYGAQLGSGKDVGRDKRITAAAKEEEIAAMRASAYSFWPKAVADLISIIPDPFMNDIYDMDALPHWGSGPVTLVGDAAHATTPHFVKSSNMAICDAVELSIRLQTASTIQEAFRDYESFRHPLTTRSVAISRQLGMVRQGLASAAPQTPEEWEALSHDAFAELMGDGRTHLGQ